jgi:acyl transferase domain-containing protein
VSAAREAIAIVGIGCRFPGGADSPEAFWRLLREGVDAIGPIPADRPELRELYDPTPGAPGKIATPVGGFLNGLDLFEPSFFGISPREANAVDPQQRLLLETTWEAFEDAGIVVSSLAGRNVGIFVGMWTNEYEDRMFGATSDVDLYITTGGGRYAASGRLSYIFDFRGPSLTLDTACSSSLVALHLACQSLRSGECELAVAAASNLILTPHISVGYSRSRMLSPDGRCKFGDASANGYVRSEGVGVVLLKPLSRAIADGDPVHALVRGSAVNNDGRASGLLVAPGVASQVEMLSDAYEDAGVAPADVGYLEAHGTGTGVGDPVELEALAAVLGRDRPADRPCQLGSVKTNIGHAEAASGMAGLIKAALCLEHGQIPASLHFHNPNPRIPWDRLPMRMQTRLAPWPEEFRPAYAGINSFGVTGTNAHVVLGRHGPPPSRREWRPPGPGCSPSRRPPPRRCAPGRAAIETSSQGARRTPPVSRTCASPPGSGAPITSTGWPWSPTTPAAWPSAWTPS